MLTVYKDIDDIMWLYCHPCTQRGSIYVYIYISVLVAPLRFQTTSPSPPSRRRPAPPTTHSFFCNSCHPDSCLGIMAEAYRFGWLREPIQMDAICGCGPSFFGTQCLQQWLIAWQICLPSPCLAWSIGCHCLQNGSRFKTVVHGS